MTAALLAALASIRDLHLNSDADVLRDTLSDAKSIADKAIKAHKKAPDPADLALEVIAAWPANGESDPDVMGEALELSQMLASKTRQGVALDLPRIARRLKDAAAIDRETDDDGERALLEREVRNLILHPANR